jgi:hypothetical protein
LSAKVSALDAFNRLASSSTGQRDLPAEPASTVSSASSTNANARFNLSPSSEVSNRGQIAVEAPDTTVQIPISSTTASTTNAKWVQAADTEAKWVQAADTWSSFEDQVLQNTAVKAATYSSNRSQPSNDAAYHSDEYHQQHSDEEIAGDSMDDDNYHSKAGKAKMPGSKLSGKAMMTSGKGGLKKHKKAKGYYHHHSHNHNHSDNKYADFLVTSEGSNITNTAQHFVVRIINPIVIEEARVELEKSEGFKIISGIIEKTAVEWNPGWSYHFIPNTIFFGEVFIEVCDSSATYVEEHLDEAGGAFLPGLQWCPWGTRVLEEIAGDSMDDDNYHSKAGKAKMPVSKLSGKAMMTSGTGGIQKHKKAKGMTRKGFLVPTEPPSHVLRSQQPSSAPTAFPTSGLTLSPTEPPTKGPTEITTSLPMTLPSMPSLTSTPTMTPSVSPTERASPSSLPSQTPTDLPSSAPSEIFSPFFDPTSVPTKAPAKQPTNLQPTQQPTDVPTVRPTELPTDSPSSSLSKMPSLPSITPTRTPSTKSPSTSRPSGSPTVPTTRRPTILPSLVPSLLPSMLPSRAPSPVEISSPTKMPL